MLARERSACGWVALTAEGSRPTLVVRFVILKGGAQSPDKPLSGYAACVDAAPHLFVLPGGALSPDKPHALGPD